MIDVHRLSYFLVRSIFFATDKVLYRFFESICHYAVVVISHHLFGIGAV